MSGSITFKEAKKGYDKEEVHSFILSLNNDHQSKLDAKNDEIKSLLNEKTLSESRLNAEIARLEALLAEKEAIITESTGRYDELCAQMGEKLLFAEQQARAIKNSADEEKEKILSQARAEAKAYTESVASEARLKAAASYDAVQLLLKKNQIISASLEQTKRILDDTVEQIKKAAE